MKTEKRTVDKGKEAADKLRAIAFSVETIVDFVSADIVIESQGSQAKITLTAE